MVKFNKEARNSRMIAASKLVVLTVLIQLSIDYVQARKRADDIILTKGKLIMRGGKDKGNLILDTGGKSHDHHEVSMMPMMPMMPMMHHGHHFNPFSFYPMQEQQHHHQPHMVIHPIYVEDHSAMHRYKPEQHHHEYHHEAPHHHEMHHEMHQYHHEEPMQHHQMQHHAESGSPEMHHEQHYEVQPMGHHYEHEAHHDDEGHHGGYESNPMMAMMMHGSGAQPSYQQLATIQALHSPHLFAQQQQQFQQQMQALQDAHSKQNQPSHAQQQQQALPSEQQKKVIPANPLAAIIKPLLNLSPIKQKKP